MRNLKRALSLTLASIMLLGMMVVGSSAASYQDVTDEHNVEAIEVLQAVGIMVGDEGNFNPDKNVTRNEMAVIMSNLMDYRVATYSGTSPFTDVPAWAEPYVAACYTNGITSGTSATTYNGSGNVTTAQAALMIMKALGYFQYTADFGDDWQLATTRQAGRINLLDDVKANVKDAMTRNDVAQLVLNALEAGTVEADNSGNINISVGGENVSVNGNTKYDFITSTRDYAFAINDARSTTNNTDATASVVELGEKLYNGDLTKKDDTDAFGRPADIWEYQTKEIGTYAKGADYTFTAKVTGKALYNAISSTVANYPNWNVSVDGDEVDYDGADLRGMRTDDDACFLKDVAANDDYKAGDSKTGNGVLTQVYVDSTNREVNIAVIHFYAAEVLRVNKDDETITLSDLDNGPAKADDLFDTTAFEEDEIVVYSYSNKTGDIETVAAAGSMEGEVSRVRISTSGGQYRDGDNFTADGTDYKYSFTMSSEDRLQTEHVNNTVVGYTDSYGYVIYIDESAMTYDYAYVLSMNNFKDQYGDNTMYARLVLTDGTLIRVETDNDEDLTGYLVSYSKDKNDVYTLAARSTYALREAKSLDINSGVASIKADTASSKFVANSNTVFIVAQSETKNNQPDYDNYDFRVYTGIANVPDIDGVAGTQAVVAARNGNVARVVYIEDGDVSGLDDVIFVRADSKAKLEKDTELGNYYIISAVVDGSVVSWKVKELSRAAEKLVTKLTGENGESNPGKVVLAASDVYEDADGLVTNVTLYKDFDGEDGVDRGTGTGKHENSTIGLGDTRYGYNGKDVVVVKYDQWDAFSVERINSIKDDYNDKWVAVFDGNVVTGVCYIENEGTGTKPTPTPDTYSVNVTIDGVKDETLSKTGLKDGDAYTVEYTVREGKVATYDGKTYNAGEKITVTGTINKADVTVAITTTDKNDNVDVNITLHADDIAAGVKVTEAHIITSSDNISTGKYASMSVGDLYVAVSKPSTVTLVGNGTVTLTGTKNGMDVVTGDTSNWTNSTQVAKFAAAEVAKLDTTKTITMSKVSSAVSHEVVVVKDSTVSGLKIDGANTTTSVAEAGGALALKISDGLPKYAKTVDVYFTIDGLTADSTLASTEDATTGYQVLTDVDCTNGAFDAAANIATGTNAKADSTKTNVTITIKDVKVKTQEVEIDGASASTLTVTTGTAFNLPQLTVTVGDAVKTAKALVSISGVTSSVAGKPVTNREMTLNASFQTTADTDTPYTSDGKSAVKITVTPVITALDKASTSFQAAGYTVDSVEFSDDVTVENGANTNAVNLVVKKAANFGNGKKYSVEIASGADKVTFTTADATANATTTQLTIPVAVGALKNITGEQLVVVVKEITP